MITATGNVLGLGVQDKPGLVLISPLESEIEMLKLHCSFNIQMSRLLSPLMKHRKG